MDLLDRCARARFFLPDDAVLVGVTALHLRGIEVGDVVGVHAATATAGQTRRAGVRLSRVAVLPSQTNGVAEPVPAWRDARLNLGLVDLVAAGDALVRRELATLDELRAIAAATTGRRCRHLRRAADLVRERVDSVPETRLRLCTVLAGLPEPRCNVVLGGAGRVLGRVDLLVDGFGLILEYDGDQHRDNGQWNQDLDRDDAFTAAGFETIRVTRQRMRRPRALITKLHERLVAHGYDGPAPVFGKEWLESFERRM